MDYRSTRVVHGRKSNLMSEESDVFDVERVRDLVQLMIDHGLAELDLRQHGQTIKLRRDGVVGSAPAMPMPVAQPAAMPVAAAAPAAADSAPDEDLHVITSPMVGTFYCRPQPGVRFVRESRTGRIGEYDDLHHRSDEGVQRNRGRGVWNDRRCAGRKTKKRSNLANRFSRFVLTNSPADLPFDVHDVQPNSDRQSR